MRDILLDLVKNVRATDIGTVKITGEDGVVTIQGVDDQKTVILKGTFTNPVDELEGVCGIGNLDRLASTLGVYSGDSDVVSVARKMRTSRVEVRDEEGKVLEDVSGNAITETVEENAIERFVFNKTQPMKMESNFRVISKNLIPNQFGMKEVEWNISLTPTASAIEYLDKLRSISNSDTFTVKVEPVEDGTNSLYVLVGEPGNEARMEFHKNVDGALKNSWQWDLEKVMRLLKLGTTSTLTMNFSDRGVLRVVVDSGLAQYNFTIPPRQQ